MNEKRITVPSAELACRIYGEGPVSLVIEMGLGAAMAEWRQLAERLSDRHTVLLYQRAGCGASGASALPRTPAYIVRELEQLLAQVPHTETLTLLGHSQGGLYAWRFAQLHPELVKHLVLMDPLSPENYRFRLELTEELFRKSGADKTEGMRQSLRLTRRHLGWLVRLCMRSAPPFCYCRSFSPADRREILAMLGESRTYETALAEYEAAHDMNQLSGFLDRGAAPWARVTLVTHDSEIACRELQKFGGASEQEAREIEVLWQKIMQAYLACAPDGESVRAENSSHSIHLTDADLVCRLV